MQFLFVSTCLGIDSEIVQSDPSDEICWRVCSNGLSHRPAPMGISQVRIFSRTAELEIGIRSEIGTVHSSYRGGQSYSSAFLTMPNVIYTVIQKGSQFFDGRSPKCFPRGKLGASESAVHLIAKD